MWSCYLKDLPTWENEKVTLHLCDAHTFDSNLTTQIPHLGNMDGLVAKKFAPSEVGNYDKQVLTSMQYKIRYVIGPYRYASPITMNIDDNTKALMETTGYLHDDRPIGGCVHTCSKRFRLLELRQEHKRYRHS